jgi:ribosome-interacting GTPase 1
MDSSQPIVRMSDITQAQNRFNALTNTPNSLLPIQLQLNKLHYMLITLCSSVKKNAMIGNEMVSFACNSDLFVLLVDISDRPTHGSAVKHKMKHIYTVLNQGGVILPIVYLNYCTGPFQVAGVEIDLSAILRVKLLNKFLLTARFVKQKFYILYAYYNCDEYKNILSDTYHKESLCLVPDINTMVQSKYPKNTYLRHRIMKRLRVAELISLRNFLKATETGFRSKQDAVVALLSLKHGDLPRKRQKV